MSSRETEIEEKAKETRNAYYHTMGLITIDDVEYLLRGLKVMRRFIQDIFNDPSLIDSMKKNLKEIQEGNITSLEELRQKIDLEKQEDPK